MAMRNKHAGHMVVANRVLKSAYGVFLPLR